MELNKYVFLRGGCGEGNVGDVGMFKESDWDPNLAESNIFPHLRADTDDVSWSSNCLKRNRGRVDGMSRNGYSELCKWGVATLGVY